MVPSATEYVKIMKNSAKLSKYTLGYKRGGRLNTRCGVYGRPFVVQVSAEVNRFSGSCCGLAGPVTAALGNLAYVKFSGIMPK